MLSKQQGSTEQKHKRFIEWFIRNGGYMKDIDYKRFKPIDYMGIAARTDIKKNTVILGVPKRLIIGIDRVKHSQIGHIIQQYQVFQGEDNDDKDFNILTLFIIMEKMKAEKSFYAEYLECIEIAQTLVYWTDQEIQQIGDPFLNVNFMNQIRGDFIPTFQIFKQIVAKYPQIFVSQLTRQLFHYSYGVVMTRCFGWGLPQTMLVPFADFLNHHSNGVHHYAFSMQLQDKNHHEYIKKIDCLDLQIFGRDNKRRLPIDYQKDSRQNYVQKNKKILQKNGVILNQDVRRLMPAQFKQYLKLIRSQKVKQNFQCELLLSSDSQDNDSVDDQQNQQPEQLMKKNQKLKQFYDYKQYFKRVYHMVDANKDTKYIQPKPSINQQFQENTSFSWWSSTQDSQFIVATSQRITQGQEVYNSYGRRNNRFLLLWYGFTFEGNKYDSVPFRLWSQKVYQQTGKRIFTRYLTQKDWKNKIPIGNKRYSYSELTQEFRLKLTELNYYLIAQLRFKIILDDIKYKEYRCANVSLSKVSNVQLELEVFQNYYQIVKLVAKQYNTQPRKLNMKYSYRQCFANILIESNRSITEAHLKGVHQIMNILHKLKNQQFFTSQTVLELYHNSWQINSNEDQNIANHIFLRHYYKQLHDFAKK